MTELSYTLLTDGSSDRALIPILNWSLRQNGVTVPIQGTWADLRRLRNPPVALADRIKASLDYYPCNLLFVHRDCEGETVELRCQEIGNALESLADAHRVPSVCVVPRRMTETWLLIDEDVIRQASGNPRGRVPLHMRPIDQLEALANPKEVLFELLRNASELRGRRLRCLQVRNLLFRIADLIEDFGTLRRLEAFNSFEQDLRQALAAMD